ncbi:MAG: hypothetical protein R3B82_04970 [Sandaracinaceae bacterium]
MSYMATACHFGMEIALELIGITRFISSKKNALGLRKQAELGAIAGRSGSPIHLAIASGRLKTRANSGRFRAGRVAA